MGTKPYLELENIVKKFPGVVANDHISMTVEEGEIHGLLGENGAGKSTLMKILYGLYTADSGEIRLNGDPASITSPPVAIEAGIGMVHQHFKLIPRLTVTENIVLGDREGAAHQIDSEMPVLGSMAESGPIKGLLNTLTLNRDRPRKVVNELISRYGMDINPESKVWELDIGEQQRVEIIKALYQDVDLLILDEPTAVLTPQQTERLFETLEEIAASGTSIIFITHKLNEVKAVTDRVTILREGKVVDTVNTDTVTTSDLARLMVGREVLLDIDKTPPDRTGTVLAVSDLKAKDVRGVQMVNGLSLSVSGGEIVGIAGVSGNGQAELAKCLAGVKEPADGTIKINGSELTGSQTKEFIQQGVSYIPEDRLKSGGAPDLDITANSMLKEYQKFAGRFFLDYDEADVYAEQLVEEFDVRVPNTDVAAGKLSGGNLQKLIAAREVSRDPELIIAHQPTRGVDVGAKEFIQSKLIEQRDAGSGILLISESLDEVLQLSDRILVMYEGDIAYETTAESADRGVIGRYMTEGDTDQVASDTTNEATS